MAASARADFIQKKLANEGGLGPDAIDRYIETLRHFLTAKFTKIRFEEEMAKVLPRDKICVHNSIIRELLHRAQMKREGLPDVPVLPMIKDKNKTPSRNRPAPSTGRTGTPSTPLLPTNLKAEPVHMQTSGRGPTSKRKDPTKPDYKANGITDVGAAANHIRHRSKPVTPKDTAEKLVGDAKGGRRPREPISASAPSPKRFKRVDPSGSEGNGVAPQTPNGAVAASPSRGSHANRNNLGVPLSEIPTYDTLSFQPVQPGQAIDFQLFVKMRTKMARIVERMGLTGGVKDEAVALLTHSLEAHMKRMLEACVEQRIARECTRPAQYRSCEGVTTYDLRESLIRDLSLLGADPSMSIERLSMLL